MKKITLLTLTLVFLAAFSMVMGPKALQAQVHQMTSQMCTNLGQCSAMITEMTEMLKSGKLSPAEEREVINHIDQIGRIMREMASPDGPSLEKKHTRELEETMERWRRLREIKRGMQVKPGH